MCECRDGRGTYFVVVAHDGPFDFGRVYPCHKVFHMSGNEIVIIIIRTRWMNGTL